MRRSILMSAACVIMMAAASVTLAEAETEGHAKWLTDLEAARKLASERKVPILANFSGSDWCGWCIKLDKEVFSTKAFQTFAKDNLVLFLADFPSRKKLPAEVEAQNEALAKRYGIRGFPTVLLLNSEGEQLERTGYQRGGPQAYIKHIKDLLDKAATKKPAS